MRLDPHLPVSPKNSLNRPVFFVPLMVLLATVMLSLWRGEAVVTAETVINNWILRHFSPLFAGAAIAFLVLLLLVALSPLGGRIIGGTMATPLLTRWRWFAVTLCTTIATGILFWGAAEPLFHLNDPPAMLGIEPGSDAAATFAMSTMFLHWTLTPYAIYTVAGLTFALVYYDRREPFSLSSLFVPLVGQRAHGAAGTAVDILCLFALVAGMAASLGAGVLALAGGIEGLWGIAGGAPLRWGIAAAIVGTFVVSAALGLQRGIARLSLLNIWLFAAVLLFVVVAGPAARLPGLGLAGVADYVATFAPRSLGLDVDSDWHRQWTIFNWANWIAWAPVTALFLGRLAVGYSVRAFILVNLLLPALFGAAWMIVIAGTTITLDQQSGGSLYTVLTSAGPDPLLYRLFSALGGGVPVLMLLIGAIFISYVTAADSNVSAMSALSTHGISPETPEAPLAVKAAWGITVGLVATILVAAAGIDGIRMMSVLGGFPALFIILGAAASLAVMAIGRQPLTAPADR
ncbi:BCCT family transporter [Sphingopyxis alaskensis]|jgi:choline-glycine betaine transporter|uniref:BCCT transporter n=1 Tax=Sphingopyxis alaskensis (strain DSM 13593 / LMG 18877 / RB2256) TaxID=317655 RepID=Q1GUM7_SPHAL|nr:BCCT family transporter [Sphingopyxis alaskensis]ABF52645.1 BCCT transporter [Sphingopyxis alaskensis RB2256]